MKRRVARFLVLFSVQALFAAFLASCSFLNTYFSSEDIKNERGATIALTATLPNCQQQQVQSLIASRTITTDATTDDLSSLSLTCTPSSGTATTVTASSFSDLTTALTTTYFAPGSYTFTLSATLDSYAYSGSTTATLTAGENALSITLTATGSGYGGFSVSITLTDASDVTAVKAHLEDTSGNTKLTAESLSVSDSAVTYAKSADDMESASLSSGTYRIVIAFYGGSDSSLLLNTYKERVRILPGATSSASRTLTLNEVYTITWNNDSGELASSDYSEPSQYSRKSDTITLPLLTKSGYLFAGWYTSSAFTSGTEATEIAAGSTGDKTFYARFIQTTLYVSSSGIDSNDGLSESTPLATLSAALDEIDVIAEETSCETGDWIIYVSGSFNNTAVAVGTPKAASLTIQALTDSSTDVLTGSSSNPVLTLTNTIPVTIKDLTIMNGKCGITASGTESVTVSGSAIANCSGSGISVTGTGAVTVETSLISGNSAENGGGIYAESGTTVTVTDSTIKTNTASSAGGGIYSAGTLTIDAATVGNKDATDVASSSGYANKAGSQGGGIYSSGTVVIKSGSYVTYNYVSDSSSGTTGGGGILIEGGNLTIEDGATISYNSASCRGGGIDVINGTSGATVTMNGGTITYNAAGYFGGGVMFGETESSTAITTFTMKSGTISYNSATGSTGWAEYGGGVYVVHGTFDMQGGEISHNETTNGGAGVFVGTADNASLFTMSGGTISDNAAGTVGGGVCNNSIFTMTGGTISGNSATTYGGGVYNAGTVYMAGSAVIGDLSKTEPASADAYSNYAVSYGGGMYSTGNVFIGYTDASTADSAFTGGICYNYSNYQGGAMYVMGSAATLKMSAGSLSYNGAYSDGGAVRMGGTGDVFTMEGGTVKGNVSNLANTGNGGGGFYLGSSTYLVLSGDASVTGNTAWSGGGIYSNGATVTMSGDACVSQNETSLETGYGGGIYTTGTLSLCGSALISENSCSGTGGGGVYTAGGTVYIGYSLDSDGNATADTGFAGGITGNTASESGGGLYASIGSPVIRMCAGSISENTAAGWGGGLCLGGSASFTMSGGTVSKNSSEVDGGGLYTDTNATARFTGGTVTGNAAESNGSGVYSDGLLYMGGSAVIESSNDVYLPTYYYIWISDALTGTAPVATITPAEYTAQIPILKEEEAVDGSTNGYVSVCYGKFAVTANGTSAWAVDSGGCLVLSYTATFAMTDYDSVSDLAAAITSATGNISVSVDSATTESDVAAILSAIKESSADTVQLDLSASSITSLSDSKNYLNNNEKLMSIVLPESYTMIEDSIFQACTGLVSVTIPNTTTAIGSAAFQSCKSLTTVIFEDTSNVATIDSSAFQGCTALTFITLPASVTSIGGGTFNGCSSLSHIYFEDDSSTWTAGTTTGIAVTDAAENANNLTNTAYYCNSDWSKETSSSSSSGSTTATDGAVSGLSDVPTSGNYGISTLSELEQLRTWVNAGNSMTGVTFTLTADVDLESAEWTPIGSSSSTPFAGTFDGGGYEITNFVSSSSYTYVGFFGYVKAESGNETLIENLTVSGTSSMVKGGSGSIVGTVAGAGTVTIKHCTGNVTYADGTGSVTGYIGGIVGNSTNSGTLNIISCKNYASLTNENSAANGYIGGILGRASAATTNIINCANYGNLSDATSGRYAAGILGYSASGATVTITQCLNTGTVTATNAYAIACVFGSNCTTTFQYNLYLSGCASSVSSATVSNCSAFTGTSSSCVTSTAITYDDTTYAAGTSVLELLNAMAGSTYANWAYNTDSASSAYGYPDLE